MDFEALKLEPLIQLAAPGFELAAFIEGTTATLNEASSEGRPEDAPAEEGKDPEDDGNEDSEPAEGEVEPGATGKSLPASLESSGVKTANPLVNLSVGLVVLAGVLAAVCGAAGLALACRKHREKIKLKLIAARDGFLWNGAIRSASLGYMNLCIAAYVQLVVLRDDPAALTPGAVATAVVLVGALLGYVGVCLAWLLKHRDELDTPACRAKAGNLYAGLALHRGKWTVLYQPLFLLRRLCFFAIPAALGAASPG